MSELKEWTIRGTTEPVKWIDTPWSERAHYIPTHNLENVDRWICKPHNGDMMYYWTVNANE